MTMNKPYLLKVLAGSIGSWLKIPNKEVILRLDHPERYYANFSEDQSEFELFVNSVVDAETKLRKICEDRQKTRVYEKDKDYLFQFYKSAGGVYLCYYKLMDIEPS